MVFFWPHLRPSAVPIPPRCQAEAGEPWGLLVLGGKGDKVGCLLQLHRLHLPLAGEQGLGVHNASVEGQPLGPEGQVKNLGSESLLTLSSLHSWELEKMTIVFQLYPKGS